MVLNYDVKHHMRCFKQAWVVLCEVYIVFALFAIIFPPWSKVCTGFLAGFSAAPYAEEHLFSQGSVISTIYLEFSRQQHLFAQGLLSI